MTPKAASEEECGSAYLDLLQGVLTDTIYATEPDLEGASPSRFMNDFIKHYIQGRAISMLPLCRFRNLRSCIEQSLTEGVEGDLIETGVWRGGAAIFMRAVLKVYHVTDRIVWAADSFEGLPEPDAEKYPAEAKAFHGVVQTKVLNHLAVGLDEVRANFDKFGLLDGQVRFLKGWFKDTLHTAPIEKLCVLRLDGDHFESTWDALHALYPRVSPGGFVIIDDYGEESWTYCKQAVEKFRDEHGIAEPLVKVDSSCHYWRRSR